LQIETFFSVSHQVSLFLMSVLLGAAMGVVYDFFRVLRIVFPLAAKSGAVLVQDIIFWLIYGFAIFSYATLAARGQVRFFIFFGSLIGFALYILTIGNFVTGILRRVFSAIYGTLRKVYSIIIEPIVNLLRKNCQKADPVFVGSHENDVNSMISEKNLLKSAVRLVYNKKAKLGSSTISKEKEGDRIERGKRSEIQK